MNKTPLEELQDSIRARTVDLQSQINNLKISLNTLHQCLMDIEQIQKAHNKVKE